MYFLARTSLKDSLARTILPSASFSFTRLLARRLNSSTRALFFAASAQNFSTSNSVKRCFRFSSARFSSFELPCIGVNDLMMTETQTNNFINLAMQQFINFHRYSLIFTLRKLTYEVLSRYTRYSNFIEIDESLHGSTLSKILYIEMFNFFNYSFTDLLLYFYLTILHRTNFIT